MNNTTVADFTVQLTLTKEVWNAWKEFKKKNRNWNFREYLAHELETQVSSKPAIFKEASDKVEVACINFAYDNKEIIELLKQRG